jgi:sialate O-acetylesterase
MSRAMVLGFWRAVALVAIMVSAAWGDVRLPGFFSDHMVFQRDMPIAIWGWADAGELVTVSLGAALGGTRAGADGRWQLRLPAQPAGGPYVLEASGSSKVTFDDVMIGEVWLCSGQSNMAWTVQNCDDFENEKQAAAANAHIRHVRIERSTAGFPVADVKAEWRVCSPETVGGFTAAGYFFARELKDALPGVAIGVINSSWGGTRIEPWTAPTGFAGVPALKGIYDKLLLKDPSSAPYQEALQAYLKELQSWTEGAQRALREQSPLLPSPAYPETLRPYHLNNNPHQQPATLYNAMIHPLLPYSIRGALWYQGESNLGEGMLYFEKKKALVQGWRQLWQQGDFPFYFVQLAPYNYGDPKKGSEVMGRFWEAQAACEAIPGVGMVVINDIGNPTDIHPRNKQDVGKRLALLAMAKSYGMKDVAYSGPTFDRMEIEEQSLRVFFKHAEGLRTRDGQAPNCFEIAGPENDFTVANAVIDGQSVVLSHPAVKSPCAMRFSWHKYSVPNLVNAAGLPTGAFRAGEAPKIDYLALKIPEAKDYQLIYDLEIGKGGKTIVYDYDGSQHFTGKFDRVAYFLELKKGDEELSYAYASMDAFTEDLSLIGVPTVANKAKFAMKVNNLTVFSNVAGIVNGEMMQDSGCIEIYPNNYGPANSAQIPNASNELWDFGDQISNDVVNGHGAMQVHNYAAKQTIFAYNNMRAGNDADLGIGNSPILANKENTKRTRDWTFHNNASQYSIKRLRVLVRAAN